MPSAEIITIGTELLLGQQQDTNTQYIAQMLQKAGIDLFRSTTIGDNLERIAAAIYEACNRAEIVLTTGGLGPTVDDPTREAVARSFGIPLEFRNDLWDQIQERFKKYGRIPTENNRRQAYIPIGAQPIINPVGTAPGFWLETNRGVLICMPGVPKEMEYLMENFTLPFIDNRFNTHDIIHSLVLHVAGVGESQVDEWISEFETLSNPTVGLLAHTGIIDIRITVKSKTEQDAKRLITPIEKEIRLRLNNHIFGVNSETLEQVTANKLTEFGKNLVLLERGTDHLIFQKINSVNLDNTLKISTNISGNNPVSDVDLNNNIYMRVDLQKKDDFSSLNVFIDSIKGKKEYQQTFGGHYELSKLWAVNISLDFLRRYILE